MTTAVQADELLSVRGASEWLMARGVKASSRHMVLVAIAKGTLPVAATTQRQFLVRESDLEKFAERQNKAARNK